MRHPIHVKSLFFLCAGFFLGLAASNFLLSEQGHLCLDQKQGRVQSERLNSYIKTRSLNGSGEKRSSSSIKQDCVCGVTAERLKRLAKLALFVSSLNQSSSSDNCGRALPTARPEDEKELKTFLYQPDKQPVQSFKEAEAVLHNYEPKTLKDEYVFKQQVFVAVLTQQEYLPTRAKSLYETWGKEVDKLAFFVGEDCNISAELSHLPIVKLVGIRDHVYPPLKKTFAVMKYMFEHYMHQFNWFVRADDDMYLRADKLTALLSQIHPYDKVYLGRAGTGRSSDLDRLLLLPHEKYCMGGPGIILSTGTLRQLGPHLSNCLDAVLSYSKTNYNDDDVEIGRCISRKINTQCSSSLQSRDQFIYDYNGLSLNPVTLWTAPNLRNAISIHPVKDPNHMLSLHYFYQSLQLQKNYEDIHEMIVNLNHLCARLPAYVAPPFTTSSGCNLKFHPNNAFFNSSSHNPNYQGQFSRGFLIHKEKFPFYLQQTDKFDLHPWTRFNDSKTQESYGISPEHTPSSTIRAEMSHILDKLRFYLMAKFSPDRVKINHILDGYTRFSPQLGREYIFTLKLTVGSMERPTYRKYHLIRPLDPQLSVFDQHYAPSSRIINIILPLERVGDTFSDFLLSFSDILSQHSENQVHLVVVVFSDDQAILVERDLQRFTTNNFISSASVVTANGIFDHFKALDIGMESLKDENSLTFLADVSLRFGPGFFRRCRSNTELGKYVYFPIAFWLYEMSYRKYSNGNVPPILPWVGKWGAHHFHLMCIYKKDYNTAGGYQKSNISDHLFKELAVGHLDIMQAPDPGLFRTWTNRNCKDLNLKRKTICLELKRAGYFEQPEVANYLGELQNIKGNVLEQKIPRNYD